VGISGLIWLFWHFGQRGFAGINLDVVNFAFLMVGVLLHWKPTSFLKAAQEGGSFIWGVVVQFPFYAGIFGLITYTKLGDFLTDFFVKISSPNTYLPIIYIYSGILNYFIPSGGSKWSIEASYILQAGRKLGISDPAVILAYSWGDMMTDIIQPFWAIPLLAVAGLKFGQIMGYCTVIWIFYAIMITICMFFMPLNLGW
jgi:short-chain fatty acids transporter